TGCVLTVRLRSSAGPFAIKAAMSWRSTSDASASVSRICGRSPYSSIMPTDGEPCPGNTIANFIVVVSHLNERCAPGEAAADAFEHHLVAGPDAPVTHGDVERKRHRGRRRVRVL